MGKHWSHHLDKDTKRCSECKEIKPTAEFGPNSARYDGLMNYCRLCRCELEMARRQAKRRALLDFLGGKCVHCGFDDWRALQVDHVNGDGAEDRRDGKSQTHLVKLVRANPERFQILCANCNSIKRVEGRENFDRRHYARTVLQERTLVPRGPSTPRTSYGDARTIAAEARSRELAELVDKRRPVERHTERLPVGSWSRFYERCLGCEETTRSHASDGCCWKCDKLIKGYNRRERAFAATAE